MVYQIIIGALVAIVAALLWLTLRRPKAQAPPTDFHQRLDTLQSQFDQQMHNLQMLLANQLQEHRATLQQTNQHIGTRLDNAAQIVGKVQERLVALDEGNKRILEVGKDLASLQDILRTPKLRGNLGELFLGDMLGQMLPKNQFTLQYAFKSGERVDAIVKLKDGFIVPIDAKFPLESFRRAIAADDPIKKEQLQRLFRSDVKKHIDSIASKYILPNEGTFDFALMYIPAENIYYETIMKEDDDNALFAYAIPRRVIPVSPNTLYIYLQAILLGLKGLKIEEEAMKILKNLQSLNSEFSKFAKDYAVLGSHLVNAQTKYLETERQMNKIGLHLETIDTHTADALPPPIELND